MKNRVYYNILILVTVLGLGAAIYSNTFSVAFHFDDDPSIAQNYSIRDLGSLSAIWSFSPTRFLTYLSLALNYNFHQLRLFGYHLVNLIIHLGTSIFAWYLARLTLSTPAMREKRISRHAELIALFTGLVFLTHPIQTQAVTYIIQRATSLASLFYLASLSLYAKSRLLEERAPSLKVSRIYYLGSLLTAILAMFSKEMAITLPLAILLYEYCFLKAKNDRPRWKWITPFLLALLIIPLTMFLTKKIYFSERDRMSAMAPNVLAGHYLFTQFRVLVTYLRLLVLPINQNLDYDYPVSKSILELPTLASLITLVIILYIAIRLYHKHRLISFAIFWFFLTLLPESSVIPIRDVIFEHRLYLATFGYSLFLVTLAYYLLAKHTTKPLIIIFTIIISTYSILAYQRNSVWKDEFTLWNDALQKSPRKARPYYTRGFIFQNQGKLEQALADYNQAIEINPNYIEAYINRGTVYLCRGNLNHAIRDYNKAVEINPNAVNAYYNRASAYQEQGNLNQAIADYGRVIQIDPDDADAYVKRGNSYIAKGNLALAVADYNKAIEINPNFIEPYYNRAKAYFSLQDYPKSWEDVARTEELGYKVNTDFLEALKKASGRNR